MKLYVVRHGPAGPGSADPVKERERGLTDEGVDTVAAIASAMKTAGELPTVIFASPFSRAVQTADILGKAFGVRVDVVGDLAPDRPLDDAILSLVGHKELKRFAIVGHADNTTPTMNRFGGSMGDFAYDGDESGDWPKLAKGEVRRVSMDRKSGAWETRWRLRPSDLGLKDEF